MNNYASDNPIRREIGPILSYFLNDISQGNFASFKYSSACRITNVYENLVTEDYFYILLEKIPFVRRFYLSLMWSGPKVSSHLFLFLFSFFNKTSKYKKN